MVQHRAYTSKRGAASKRIALMAWAFLYQHCRHGTAAAIQLGFDYRAARGAIRIGPEIHHVGLQQNHFEQPLDPFAGARGNRHRDRFAAVIPGTQPLLAELLRSEEHTSELQSHLNLVCRLLLEKKKQKLFSTLIVDIS